MKLTVKEYATQLNVSVQSVYKKIKLGSLTTVKENGTTYVIVDSLEVKKVVKPIQSNDCTELLNIIKRRDKEVKQLRKEIKRLTKKNESVFSAYLGEYQKAISAPKKDNPIEVKIKKKKEKKSKKKKKHR